jgi:hypothetical protein
MASIKATVAGSRSLNELVDQVKRSVTEVESMQGKVDTRHEQGKCHLYLCLSVAIVTFNHVSAQSNAYAVLMACRPILVGTDQNTFSFFPSMMFDGILFFCAHHNECLQD